jgi:hypothetical protein
MNMAPKKILKEKNWYFWGPREKTVKKEFFHENKGEMVY